MRIFSKLNSNEYNNQLEKILENKTFDESVKNLLLSMLYKIENGYNDYFKVKPESMEKAITETNRRRKIQEEYNKEHGITPKTIKKSVREAISAVKQEDIGVEFKMEKEEDVKKAIEKLTDQMLEYAANMEFEKAAETRDKIKELEKLCQ